MPASETCTCVNPSASATAAIVFIGCTHMGMSYMKPPIKLKKPAKKSAGTKCTEPSSTQLLSRVAFLNSKKQSFIEGRISELDDKLARADVIDVSKLTGGKIRFGATVSLIDVDSEEESSYKIVGDDEANVKEGKISISSPIARALIGKEEGDEAEVAAPSGARAYEIVKVEYR